MSPRAGQGMPLVLTLRCLGREFPCLLDTGAQGTVLPDSLTGLLGPRRGVRRVVGLDGVETTHAVFGAPAVYLGTTRLAFGETVDTSARTSVLGMDCLGRYAIQLDFQEGWIRFPEPDSVADHASLHGEEFQLTEAPQATIRHPAILQTQTVDLIVDTGDAIDGRLPQPVLERLVQEGTARPLPSHPEAPPPAGTFPPVLVPEVIWHGRTYRNLILAPGPETLGLRFLGRHRVTFNFPKRRLYLLPIGSDLPVRVTSGSSPNP